MKLGPLGWLGFQRRKPIPLVELEADLTGKTVLVLGANAGLGLEAATHFARMNPARLILACRSESRGKIAVEKIKAAVDAKYHNALELSIVDLADFASVTRFADKFESEDNTRLDILVENAAIMSYDYQSTKDGFEASLQVANLSTPLVALRLLPIMLRTARENSTVPRIVIVSSDGHYWASIDKRAWGGSAGIIKTLGSEEYCRGRGIMLSRYSITKLLNVFFMRALATRLPASSSASSSIVVNAVHPGMCITEIFQSFSTIERFLIRLIQSIFAFTAEEGSRQLVFAAVGEADHPERLHGEFIMGGEPQEVSDFVLSEAGKNAEERLWNEIVGILGKVDPKVVGVVKEYLS
ncbi:hypothetical protein C8F01DRAFT_1207113 [Mycena amicta]|nr:hypothetical protein C8F01DRAFT_1207113 [Mycena amicta]